MNVRRSDLALLDDRRRVIVNETPAAAALAVAISGIAHSGYAESTEWPNIIVVLDRHTGSGTAAQQGRPPNPIFTGTPVQLVEGALQCVIDVL